MGIFGNTSSFDPIVEKCTAETNTKEDWGLMLDICDKVGTAPDAPRECFRAIVKRLRHQDPHVVLLAITLLDTCVSNCGLPFHLEIASREFEQEFRKLLQKHQEKTIRDKMLSCLQKWAENEFKSDPQLDLIPTLYNSLRGRGYDFPSDSPSKSKKSGHHHHHHKAKEQAVATVQQEEADLAKAIELSLKEAQVQGSPQNKSLYPQVSGAAGTSTGVAGAATKDKEPRKVRALYDFEAAEDNELTFYSGEIVFVSDDSDPNWWEGENQRGRGLFPANFVTPDLDAEPSTYETKKLVQFAEEVEVKSIETIEPEVVEIDETKIDTVLHMLHEADPTGEVVDPPELASVEEQVQQMGPLIDQELEKIDRRHAQLTRLGGELVEALNMYHNLMRDPGVGPPVSLPYNMKMGMGVAGPAASVPNFHPGGPIQHPYGPYPYDMNGMSYQNAMMRPPNQPPHSAPPSTGPAYNNMPYTSPPQMNGVNTPQVNSPSHSGHPNSVPASIPNSQPPMTQSGPIPNQQQPPASGVGQMNMNVPPMTAVPGQIPYSSPMMMTQPGQPPVHMGHIHQSVPPSSGAPGSQMTNMGPVPNMQMPPGMAPQPQQFGPPPPQFYSHPPANAPAM
ncbi:unnamed protein product [Orchesella dallaii]|uniref:Signal transducing adapter molecule 1 n=1 Tax=Orchesella dallaii TaxID=48710 RepID=A0ABP1S5C0_9HEXA